MWHKRLYNVIKLRVLRWGDYPRGRNVIRGLYKRKAGGQRETGKCYAADFEDGERAETYVC